MGIERSTSFSYRKRNARRAR